VKESDRLRRELVFYDASGEITLVTHSSKHATELSAYHNAVRAFLIYGDDAALRKFEGKRIVIGGVQRTFLTDKRVLSRLARAGELNILDIYKD